MNQEPHPPTPEDRPERRHTLNGDHRRADESMLVITSLLSGIENAHARSIIADGYLDHGSAFAAYLMTPGIDLTQGAERLIDQFTARYKASWSTKAELIDAHAESLGWNEALDAFCAENRIPDRLVAWDQDEFLDWLRRTLDIVALDGQWHVFSETEG